MNFSFDAIDFCSLIKNNDINDSIILNNSIDTSIDKKNDLQKNEDKLTNFDKTTSETYRIKRIFKIDPLTDLEVSENLAFKFLQEWNPYTGIRGSDDIIGPLYFNAINLYDYYFSNRYKGLWNPPSEQYQGYYGDFVGTGKNIKIKSRGSHPERYLYRIPIIDCYLPTTHNYSHITMGPELTDQEIIQIDIIISKYHSKKFSSNFTSLTTLKYYYDMALEISPDPNSDEIKELKIKYPFLNEKEINEKFNRYWVDKLVKLKL
jgi:hypothetical protein